VQYEKKVKHHRTSVSQTTGAAIGLLALGLAAGVAACWVRVTHGPFVWFVIGLVGAVTALALGALSLIARWIDFSHSGM
jgi:fumarate reductase subunit C